MRPFDVKDLRLSDGRTVSVATYGNPDSPPVLFCHGFPGSHLDWMLIDPQLELRHALIIAPDRPGYGGSTPIDRNNLGVWTEDAREILDLMKIDSLPVLGVSGGGPYALACASLIPERIDRVAVASSMGPASAPSVEKGASWTIPGKLPLMRRAHLSRMSSAIDKDPEAFFVRHRRALSDVDRALMDDAEIADALLKTLREAFQSGIEGALVDAKCYRRKWGFMMKDIEAPAAVWHGGQDKNVPMLVAQFMVAAIPDCSAHILESGGHLTTPNEQAREILGWLLKA